MSEPPSFKHVCVYLKRSLNGVQMADLNVVIHLAGDCSPTFDTGLSRQDEGEHRSANACGRVSPGIYNWYAAESRCILLDSFIDERFWVRSPV
jgi:hypothetical protein